MHKLVYCEGQSYYNCQPSLRLIHSQTLLSSLLEIVIKVAEMDRAGVERLQWLGEEVHNGVSHFGSQL